MKHQRRISLSQTQRLSLNASLISAVDILRFSPSELVSWIEEQGQANPSLVISRPLPTEWLPRWTDALARYTAPLDEERAQAGAGPGLFSHAMAQAQALGPEGPMWQFAEGLVAALAPSGWLDRPVASIAAEAGVPLSAAEGFLRKLQLEAEPSGLFARDLAECLRLQAEAAEELDADMEKVLGRLSLLTQYSPADFAQKLGLSVERVATVLRRIRGYDPKPGSDFIAGEPRIIEPDLIVERRPVVQDQAGAPVQETQPPDLQWDIRLNQSALPTLSLSDGPGRAQAQALIRLIEGRNATLLKVAREMLRLQAGVLDAGVGALRPMTMAEVAAGLGLHQTTVSRVVAGTSVDTPLGTWWLRRMFSPAVRPDGPAGAALRDALARLVSAEDRSAPLSDSALSEMLAEAGAPVARRTVAKYRDMLGIPPASRRLRRDL